MTRCISQIGHFKQVDWSKNTCFGPVVKMNMSISKKIPVSQFEPFEKPRILAVYDCVSLCIGIHVFKLQPFPFHVDLHVLKLHPSSLH